MLDIISRLRKTTNPPEAKPLPDSQPIRFGILGAATIGPMAIIAPAKSLSEAVIYAVAARDKDRAAQYAKKHGIEKVFGGPSGYQGATQLPNGLHYEWTMKALAAGKHVLLEKPAANTAEETRQMFDSAEKKGLVLLEAVHYRFHPAVHRAKAILESGELGPIKSTHSSLAMPRGLFNPTNDIRFNYSVGGGALMDMGCYTIGPISVVSVEHELSSPQVDRKTTAKFELPGGITSTIMCDLSMPPYLGFVPNMPTFTVVVECEKGQLEMFNYVAPHFMHSISIKPVGKKGRVEKVYKYPDGEDWHSTYRHQLEAFVSKVKGRTPRTWVTREDSIKNMEVIESVYAKSGLGSRPKSRYVPSD
ncbi:NAD(P)-binding protein [Roridomyces roridus]|uniref:D-xylose 1-dehydrogenase (NADP(+), D-xylono-1,5-lactone-forming) n=1 Tax=Roridomyces roridus TaxID=1738132 RepID=A0AAD7BN93_9AGAR|nr:NAD(P)-binding protein [Roridomyces roridus]